MGIAILTLGDLLSRIRNVTFLGRRDASKQFKIKIKSEVFWSWSQRVGWGSEIRVRMEVMRIVWW